MHFHKLIDSLTFSQGDTFITSEVASCSTGVSRHIDCSLIRDNPQDCARDITDLGINLQAVRGGNNTRNPFGFDVQGSMAAMAEGDFGRAWANLQ